MISGYTGSSEYEVQLLWTIFVPIVYNVACFNGGKTINKFLVIV